MKIIDTHVHIGGYNLGFNMNEDIVIEMMERYNISYALVSNCDAAELGHDQTILRGQVRQEQALMRVIEFARKYPDKIGVAVWVKPYLQGLTYELVDIIKVNKDIIKALKIHPFHSNVAPTDKRMLPYIELASRLGVPVISHTGGCEAADPIHVYEAAKMFPKIPFIMVHLGLGTDNKAALDLLGMADNLYGDTTWVPMDTTIEAIRRYGGGKMMFGSDAPIDGVDTYRMNPFGSPSIYQDYFNVLPNLISAEDYELLMYKNAQKLYKLDNTAEPESAKQDNDAERQ